MSLDKTKLCNQLKVVEQIKESSDSVTLVLDIPEKLRDKFRYSAGQFVTFFLDIDGQELHRSYSLCTSPDFDQKFAVTIKRVPGGRGSTFLTESVRVGDELWTTPPAGRFTLPEKIAEQKLVFFAAGSGITPIFSLIKSALKKTTLPCLLFYQNRTEDAVIFRSQLDELEKISQGRFTVTHVLSNPDSEWKGLRGRAHHNMIREFLIRHQVGIRSLYFLCGPTGFMETVETALISMSVDPLKIISESFATSPSPAEGPETTPPSAVTAAAKTNAPDLTGMVTIGDPSDVGSPELIEVRWEGETKTVPYKGNASILETLLDADLNPPYSCMDGACMACMAKVEKGLVYQADPGILCDDNIEAKECLTCQSRPASKIVRVNYDAF